MIHGYNYSFWFTILTLLSLVCIFIILKLVTVYEGEITDFKCSCLDSGDWRCSCAFHPPECFDSIYLPAYVRACRWMPLLLFLHLLICYKNKPGIIAWALWYVPAWNACSPMPSDLTNGEGSSWWGVKRGTAGARADRSLWDAKESQAVTFHEMKKSLRAHQGTFSIEQVTGPQLHSFYEYCSHLVGKQECT